MSAATTKRKQDAISGGTEGEQSSDENSKKVCTSESTEDTKLRDAVVALKKANPNYGKKRIYQVLSKNGFPDVKDIHIKKILKDEGLMLHSGVSRGGEWRGGGGQSEVKFVKTVGVPRVGENGNWQCDGCTNINFGIRSECNRCHLAKPFEFVKTEGVPRVGDNGNWQCNSCTNINFGVRTACNRCKKPRMNQQPRMPGMNKRMNQGMNPMNQRMNQGMNPMNQRMNPMNQRMNPMNQRVNQQWQPRIRAPFQAAPISLLAQGGLQGGLGSRVSSADPVAQSATAYLKFFQSTEQAVNGLRIYAAGFAMV